MGMGKKPLYNLVYWEKILLDEVKIPNQLKLNIIGRMIHVYFTNGGMWRISSLKSLQNIINIFYCVIVENGYYIQLTFLYVTSYMNQKYQMYDASTFCYWSNKY